MQNLVVVSHTACVHEEYPENFENAWGLLLWDWGVVDRLEIRPSDAYVIHTKLRRSMSNRIGVYKGSPGLKVGPSRQGRRPGTL